MGSKATYFSLSSEELIEITDENFETLPEELKKLLNRWKRTANYFKSDFENRSCICPVKGASEVFRYKGIPYVIYPSFLDVSQEYFEYLMYAKHMEDELLCLRAEEIFCTAMAD